MAQVEDAQFVDACTQIGNVMEKFFIIGADYCDGFQSFVGLDPITRTPFVTKPYEQLGNDDDPVPEGTKIEKGKADIFNDCVSWAVSGKTLNQRIAENKVPGRVLRAIPESYVKIRIGNCCGGAGYPQKDYYSEKKKKDANTAVVTKGDDIAAPVPVVAAVVEPVKEVAAEPEKTEEAPAEPEKTEEAPAEPEKTEEAPAEENTPAEEAAKKDA